MFYGEFAHSLDRKNRLIIPAKFREVLQESFVEKMIITRGLDKCLFVFSEDEWKAQEAKFKELSFTKSESRKFNRLYFSGACELQVDKQGRVLIPVYLRSYAEIKKDVVVVGVSNRIEIWAKDKWDEFYSKTKDSFEEIAEGLMEPEDKE